jgi:hypothetical protein
VKQNPFAECTKTSVTEFDKSLRLDQGKKLEDKPEELVI